MTLRTTADRAGCSFQHLARVESGERVLTTDLAARVARVVADHLSEITT